jgi:hypothetical protein
MMKKQMSGRKYMTGIILFTFVCFMFPFSALAQDQNGILMGFIYERDAKTPLEDARVVLKKAQAQKADKTYKSDFTGETGDYKMENIPEGKYKAAIELKNGKMFQTLAVVNVIGGKTVIRSFHLVPKRPFLAFFYEPCGLAMMIAGTALVIKLVEEEESPTEL